MLPVEIYHEILKYLDDQKTLASLSLTCQYLRQIVLPFLFRSLHFASRYERDMPKTKTWPFSRRRTTLSFSFQWVEPPNAKFCKLLNGGDASAVSIAKCVKSCTFRSWFSPRSGLEPDGAEIECFALCMTALAAMPNLKSLTLTRSFMEFESTIPFITKLRGLEALDVDRCFNPWKFAGDKALLKTLGVLQLKTLSCSLGEQQTQFCRYLRTRNLQVFRTSNWPMLKHVMSLRPTIKLTELEVTCPLYTVQPLWTFLSLTPTITHLTVDDYYTQPTSTRHPSSFLPNLKLLKCSLALALTFEHVSMPQLIMITSTLPWRVESMVSHLNGVVFSAVEDLVLVPEKAIRSIPEHILCASFPNVKWNEMSASTSTGKRKQTLFSSLKKLLTA